MDYSMPGFSVLHCLLSLLRFMSIESVMLSNHFFLCCHLLLCLQFFPASGSFAIGQLFTSGDQSIGVSISASVLLINSLLPLNIQGWFFLVLTGLTSLQSKRLSRVFSSTTIWEHQFFSDQRRPECLISGDKGDLGRAGLPGSPLLPAPALFWF